MYQTEPINDYAEDYTPAEDKLVEELPKGLVPDSELVIETRNVLISEFEDQTPEMIAEAINDAVNDFRRVQQNRAMLSGISDLVGESTRIRVVKDAQAFRIQLSSKYPDRRFRANETVVQRTGMLVHEEAKEQRGLFTRIIDRIIEALSWLWKKIAGLFGAGSEATKEDVEKSSKKINDVSKEHTAREMTPTLAKMDTATVERFKKGFGFLGTTISHDAFSHYLKERPASMDRLYHLIQACDEFFKDFIKTLESGSTDRETFFDCWKRGGAHLNSALSSFKTGAANDIAYVNGDTKFIENRQKVSIHVEKDLPAGKALVVTASGDSEGTVMLRSALGGHVSNPDHINVEAPTIDELQTYQAEVQAIVDTNTKHSADIISIATKNGDRTKHLATLMQKIGQSSDENTMRAAHFVNELASTASGLVSHAASAHKLNAHTAKETLRWIDAGLKPYTDFIEEKKAEIRGKLQDLGVA